MATTLKDIAEKTGLSPTTISRVLNYDKTLSVSDETRDQIFSVAEKLNYIKSHHRSSSISTKKIALVQWYSEEKEQDDLYYLMIRKGVEKRGQQLGIEVMNIFKNDTSTLETDIDGIIAVGKFSPEQVKDLALVTDKIVFVDDDQFAKGFDSLLTNISLAMKKIVDFFWKEKIRDIGLIYGEEETTDHLRKIIDRRYIAFKKELSEKHAYDTKLVFKGDFTNDSGYQVMKEAIRKLKDRLPHAFFISNDPMAAGALKALREAKIEIPKRVSIFSFNNTSLASYVYPELSSVAVGTEEMGMAAINMLKDQLTASKQPLAKRVELETRLIFRQSTL